MLYDDSRAALACLNRTSKAVHAATLPHLYDTVDYSLERHFLAAIYGGFPKAWEYVR